MSNRALRIVTVVLLVAAGIGAGTVAGSAWQRHRIAQLRAQLAEKHGTIVRLYGESEYLGQTALETAPTTQSSPKPKATAPKTRLNTAKKVRQFAFVTDATSKGSTIKLTLDYARFLTGEAAAKAAKEAGDESPPPSDSYISNPSRKLHTLPVASDAEFTIVFGSPENTAKLTADQFLDAIRGNTSGAADSGFWFTIVDGVVTSGVEQWIP